jgi:hypothetical protein
MSDSNDSDKTDEVAEQANGVVGGTVDDDGETVLTLDNDGDDDE